MSVFGQNNLGGAGGSSQVPLITLSALGSIAISALGSIAISAVHAAIFVIIVMSRPTFPPHFRSNGLWYAHRPQTHETGGWRHLGVSY